MIEVAAAAGCDAVKFQKRTPELCVPKDQWNVERDTPWGRMTYIDYRHKVEFTKDDYADIDLFCKVNGIDWFASCWDMSHQLILLSNLTRRSIKWHLHL